MVLKDIYDVCVIGGGVNGAGIARDAAGQGLSVVLFEKGDLASATSSSSTKLIHGGLRYLENYDFRLVHESLLERDVMLSIAPHIVKPMRFILPHTPDLRPKWMIRAGLFLYDLLAGKTSLKKSKSVDLADLEESRNLFAHYKSGFVYSDCWVDDARLVVLNAVSAAEKGTHIATRHHVQKITSKNGIWSVDVINLLSGETIRIHARSIVNAAGPWVTDVLQQNNLKHTAPNIRLVQGSHIIVPRLYDGTKAFIFQQPDKRIVFAIPYEGKFTLVGTTETSVQNSEQKPAITIDEIDYLCASIGRYFKKPITRDDIVWTYSGVRALFDDGQQDNRTVTRDYKLHTDKTEDGAFILSVFGGKITTYRQLAKAAVAQITAQLRHSYTDWTGTEVLPGGDIGLIGSFAADLIKRYPEILVDMAHRYARLYGSKAEEFLKNGLGRHYGEDLYEAEVKYLVEHEWARTPQDILWRRTKLGLHLSAATQDHLKRDLSNLVKEITGYDITAYSGD